MDGRRQAEGLAGWTPECASPEEILSLAESGGSSFEARTLLEHVRDCGFCMSQLADTRAVLGARAGTPAAEDSRLGEGTPSAPAPRGRLVFAFAGFAVGAVLVGAVLYGTLVSALRARGARLDTALAQAKDAQGLQAKEAQRLKQELADAQARLAAVKPAAPSADALLLEAAVLSGRLKVPPAALSLVGATRGSETVLGVGIKLLGPVDTFVLEQQPVLSAEPGPGIEGVEAVLYDADGNEFATERKSPTSWRPAAPLARGKIYEWAVDAHKGEERVRSRVASFQVADAGTAESISSARKRYSDQPLMLAVLLAQAGLLDDAEQALRDALKAHPGSAAATNLLRNLRAERKEKHDEAGGRKP